MKLIDVAVFAAIVLSMQGLSFGDEVPPPHNTQASGQHPPSPHESLRKLSVPDGFRVTLAAGGT